jgi:hypothetical protein
MMKNVYEVLRQKEADLNLVREQVESLRVVLPLLSGEEEIAHDEANTGTNGRANLEVSF